MNEMESIPPKYANIADDLIFAKGKEGVFDHIYHTYFKNVKDIRRINRMDRQRAGIDTEVTLESGETIIIQEKWRRRKFSNDFLIEMCSVEQQGSCIKQGWIFTIDADYIFVVYEKSDLIKIYPVAQLKLAWSKYKVEWYRAYETRKVKNTTYNTIILIVPVDVLEAAINEMMTFTYQRDINDSFGCKV